MSGNFVSYENMTALTTEIGNKIKALNGAYIIRGNSTFANLPTTLTASMNGYVYNVTDDFITTALFVEGAGKKYSAGTNVVIANVSTSTTPEMKFDVIGQFIDVDAITDMITTDEFDITSTYSIGDVVKYNNALYKFKSAHSAGAWNIEEVDTITVKDLIDEAKPESLTTAQVNSLISLLE